MSIEQKPWASDEIARLSSEVIHFKDIQSYHLDQAEKAGKEASTREIRIRELQGVEKQLALIIPEIPPIDEPPHFNPKGFIRGFKSKLLKW